MWVTSYQPHKQQQAPNKHALSRPIPIPLYTWPHTLAITWIPLHQESATVHLGESGVQSTLFCILNHCYFISSPNKLKICHTIKQLYIHNIMPQHENNALQKKICNQFKNGTFSVECAHAWGTLDMSMVYTWLVNKKLGCMHCIMFTWYPMWNRAFADCLSTFFTF